MTANPDFAEFYAATFGRLTAQLHAFTGDLTEAQDLVQEAFSRAYPRWDRISGYDDPAAWVRRVAWNLAIGRWRQVRRVMHWRRDLVADDVAGPDAANIDLVRALRLIPARHRQVIVLHYIAELSIAEIAELTGAAEGTVKSWLHRGRAALALHLGVPAEVTHG